MKTKRIMVWSCTICIAVAGHSQVDWHASPGGNSIGSTEYLGANSTSTVPLLLKTVANLPIDFWTSNTFRMRLNKRITYPTLNGFSGIPADGFALISPLFFNHSPFPFEEALFSAG